jgi:hypothetical protein
MDMREGARGCAGGGASSTSARGPATPRRARAPVGGDRAREGSRGQGRAQSHGRPANRAEQLHRRRRSRPQGMRAHGPGAGVRGNEVLPLQTLEIEENEEQEWRSSPGRRLSPEPRGNPLIDGDSLV